MSRLINGSILSTFSHLELSTADEKKFSLTMTPFNRLAMNIIGIPHLGFRARARLILAAARKTLQHGRILDAGCGFGLYALSLAESGYHVDAIDLDHRRIQVLREMTGEDPIPWGTLSLFQGSLTALPFSSQTYETVICSEVIEHIKNDEQAISELARVLKKGGRLIVSVPYDSRYNRRLFKRFGHERPGYTKESLGKLYKDHGLVIEEDFYYERTIGGILFNVLNAVHIKPLMGILFYPLYFFYLLDQYSGFGEPNQMVVIARKTQ